MVGVPHPTRRNNEGKNGRKHLELSERRRAFARKMRREKRAERKSARKKHKAARATAKGCDVTGLQETKRDGTSEIVASGYRVFSSGDCSGVKGRKRQHRVGLAIKKEIVKKAGEDGITIECISARLLKAQISIKSNFVTFVVVYTPTEEAPEGQKNRIPLYVCFIDVIEAYDSVDRTLLWTVLARFGVPHIMISIIRPFHDGMRACVRL